jgi:hypothetical protein
MIVIMGTTTLVPMLQLQQANAASLRQHSNLLNNCYRPDQCRQSNVHQGTAGNDNQVTGFGDLSNNGNTPTTNPTVGAPGPAGPAGPPGPKGDPGQPGPNKVLTTREVIGDPKDGGPQTFITAFANCADDEVITGGGYAVTPAGLGVGFFVNLDKRANDGSNSWSVEIFNNSSLTLSLSAVAECAKLVPPP